MKIAGRLARLEAHHTLSPRAQRIVIFDAATGGPQSRYGPKAHEGVQIWIPDNGRGDAYGDDERGTHGGDAGCD